MQLEACPEENALLRFARGVADDVELSSVEEHLDGCESCRRAVAFAASDGSLPLAPPPPLPEPGTRLGHYVVESLLGRGGMGAVFAARDETLGRRVALKLMHTAGDEVARARLGREAQVMARLSHPNVVTVYALGEWGGGRFLAMELVEGRTLDEWRKQAPRGAGEVLRCLLDAGRGLAAAHAAGVVHRDFKPANVLVGADGRARVSDFGLSRPLEAPTAAGPSGNLLLTQVGTLLGTPAYMAPEQLDGRPADARSDQFSFCLTLAEALTGARPFAAPTRPELRQAMARPPALAGLSAPVRRVVARGLSLEPAARFPSMEALLQALERAARTRGRTGLLAAVGLALGAVLVAAATQWDRAPAPPPPPVAAPTPAAVLPPQGVLELEQGDLRLLEAPGLQRAAVGDQAVADVRVSEPGEVVVVGAGIGETTLILVQQDGTRSSWSVRVRAPPGRAP